MSHRASWSSGPGQYDAFIDLFNNEFSYPGKAIMAALAKHQLRSKPTFDEEIEWTWFYLWHHEGRRARHGVSMMAPDYSHWHGMSMGRVGSRESPNRRGFPRLNASRGRCDPQDDGWAVP